LISWHVPKIVKFQHKTAKPKKYFFIIQPHKPVNGYAALSFAMSPPDLKGL
jgi:hypothetical protein